MSFQDIKEYNGLNCRSTKIKRINIPFMGEPVKKSFLFHFNPNHFFAYSASTIIHSLTVCLADARINVNKSETVDAEIKTIVHAQRVREAESRIECRLLNGPRRAQSKALAEYSAT